MKVALAQCGAGLEAVRRMAHAAAAEGCGAVCFAEADLTGYYGEAVAWDGGEVDACAAVARETGVDLLVGFLEREGEKAYIAHALFRADGKRFRYRKTHLGVREAERFDAGDELFVWELTGGIRAGIMLCLETHVPRVAETLALHGAQVIFAPFAAPDKSGSRESIWGKYIPARAYDNRVYVGCCNLLEGQFGGGLLAVGPEGETLGAFYGKREKLLAFEVDAACLSRYGAAGASPRYRRFTALRREELYD